MGVKGLWETLSPAKEDLKLSSLSGKTVAVDLSTWLVQNMEIGKQTGLDKMEQRNVFFRTMQLLKMGIYPIFVLDGEAPKLKEGAIRKRLSAAFGGSASSSRRQYKNGVFRTVSQKCEDMLERIGLPCLQSKGEADVLCALLNLQGEVSAVITEDSDVLLYGAKWAMRNLNIKEDTVEGYKSSTIQEKIGLDRRCLVVIGILAGCDYLPEGIVGVGSKKALEFCRRCIKDELDPLDRLIFYCNSEVDTAPPRKPRHCSNCKHDGSLKNHEKYGCNNCQTADGCIVSATGDWSECTCDWHNKHIYTLIEAKVKSAKNVKRIQQVIDEYLHNSEKTIIPFTQSKPLSDIKGLQDYMKCNLGWKYETTFDRILPTLTSLHMASLSSDQNQGQYSTSIQIERICKKRKENGFPCYEVEWQTNLCDKKTVISIEKESVVKEAYSSLVEEFEKKLLEKTPLLKCPARPRKRKLMEDKNSQKITKFFPKKLVFEDEGNSVSGLNTPKEKQAVKQPIKKRLIFHKPKVVNLTESPDSSESELPDLENYF